MNPIEIVKALRCFSNCNDTRCHECEAYEKYCYDHAWTDDYCKIAANIIEHLHSENQDLKADLKRTKDECRQLDENAAEVQREYKAEIELLRAERDKATQALKKIASPAEILKQAKQEHKRIDVGTAIMLGANVSYLKAVAEETLAELIREE